MSNFHLSASFTQRSSFWTAWKAEFAVKGKSFQTESDGTAYAIWFYDGPEVHVCKIWLGDIPGDLPDYTQAQNDADRADFEANYLSGSNAALQPKTSDARPRVALEKTDISKKNFFSHDWTDPTTWYGTSERIANETATDLGDQVTYLLSHANVIDTFHGKIFGEDSLKDAGGFSYRVAVTVNGVSVPEVDPHTNVGAFTVNYAQGRLVFAPALASADVVVATYHRMVDSSFIIVPDLGKVLNINFAEVQFSMDVGITDSVTFQPYGLVDVFAPQLMPGVPSGTPLPLGPPLIYKTIRDYQVEAVKSYPTYPAIGGSGWRGMTVPLVVLDWDYVSATLLDSRYGMFVKLRLQHDVPFTGTYASATFYCTSENA